MINNILGINIEYSRFFKLHFGFLRTSLKQFFKFDFNFFLFDYFIVQIHQFRFILVDYLNFNAMLGIFSFIFVYLSLNFMVLIFFLAFTLDS